MNYEEHSGYLVIDDIHGGCGYDWSIKAALYNPAHKAYYLYEDGGCSCSGPYEDWGGPFDPGSEPMSKTDLIQEINRLRTDSVYHDFTLEGYIALAQAVRDFDPATAKAVL